MTEHGTQHVTIPSTEQHEGWATMRVELPWTCITCGGPRGPVESVLSYDGSRRLSCDGWTNPCGHVETYAQIRRWMQDQQSPTAIAWKHMNEVLDRYQTGGATSSEYRRAFDAWYLAQASAVADTPEPGPVETDTDRVALHEAATERQATTIRVAVASLGWLEQYRARRVELAQGPATPARAAAFKAAEDRLAAALTQMEQVDEALCDAVTGPLS